MDNAIQWLQVSGLLLVLIVATIIFVRGIALLVRGKHHSVKLGMELLFSFGALYFASPPVLEFLNLQNFSEPITRAIAFLWWISLAFTINSILNRFVWGGLLTDDGLRRVPRLITDGIALMLYAGALMIVLHYVYKEPITAILASSGAIAFVVGLAAQPTVQEVFAGFTLNTTKALRIGDFVEIEGIYGEVWEINWRSVSLKSPNTGSLHIFPNSTVASKIILNFSEPTDLFKYWVTFHIDYSASPEQAISAIAEELENTQYICRDPKPDFNILGFTTLGMEIRLRFFFNGDDPWWPAQNEACMAIWSGLRRKGIRLGIERFKLASGDEFDLNPWINEQAALPDKNCPDSLTNHPLLHDLGSDTINHLADTARRLDYTPPDCVYLDNASDDHVYYVVKGSFACYQVLEDRSEARLKTYKKGDIFGLDFPQSDSDGTQKVQADTYGVLYQLDGKELARLAKENSEFQSKLLEHSNIEKMAFEKNLEIHAESLGKAASKAHHAELNLHIRDYVENIFAKPTLHRVMHLIRPRTLENDLLEAMMAACALIASSRGAVDNAEREFLRRNLGSVALFRYVETDHAMELFEQYAQQVTSGGNENKRKIMAKVEAISNEPKLSQVVMSIAHKMTSVHGEIMPAEELQIKAIADVLKMPASLEDLVAHAKKKAKA